MSGLSVIVVLNLVILGALAWRLRALARASRVLGAEVEQLRSLPFDAPPDLERLAGSAARPVIVIDILNALELAARESWFADKFGALAPGAIRKLVFDRALEITRQELLKHGVEAQLSLHRGG